LHSGIFFPPSFTVKSLKSYFAEVQGKQKEAKKKEEEAKAAEEATKAAVATAKPTEGAAPAVSAKPAAKK